MMGSKIFILLTIFLMLNSSCYSQEAYRDSLRRELTRYEKSDTDYINTLIEYGYYTMYDKPDSGYICGRESIELSKKIKWNKGIANGMLMLAQTFGMSAKYDSAVSMARAAVEIAETIQDDKIAASGHGMLGECYRVMQFYDRAEFHGQKCLELSKATKNDNSILNAFMTLYSIYTDQKKWNEAEKNFGPAMEIARKRNNNYQVASLLETKGINEFGQNNYLEALRCYREAIPVFKKEGDYPHFAFLQSELSRTFIMLKNKDSAAFYANAALESSKQYGLKKELMDAYDALFKYAYEFKDYKKAIEYRLIFDTLTNQMNSQQMAQNMERNRLEVEHQKRDVAAKAVQDRKDNATRKTRNIQLVALGTVILIAIFLFIYSRQKQRAKAKIEKAYSDLQAAQQQLIQSEKMASLGELTAGIAHEIQNPLNFVNNFSEVNNELLDEMVDEFKNGNTVQGDAIARDLKQNLEKINHHGRRADAIVKNMIQHSRISSGKKEPTDINALCDEYLRLAYHGMRAKDKSLPTGQAGFNVKMETSFDNSIGKVNIVSQEIGRVLINLLNNAFYAVNEKQKQNLPGYEPIVKIITKKADDKPDNYQVEITIADNGNGIPQKIIDKIFQPFFTTKPTGQGTGLGLSLAYDIVNAHGGQLTVKTDEGQGTQFIILLPAKAAS